MGMINDMLNMNAGKRPEGLGATLIDFDGLASSDAFSVPDLDPMFDTEYKAEWDARYGRPANDDFKAELRARPHADDGDR